MTPGPTDTGSVSEHSTILVMETSRTPPETDTSLEHFPAFNDKTNPRVRASSFNVADNSTNINAVRVWDVLCSRVAMNAVLNTGGHGADVKCHPRTREEVVDLIERWMDSITGATPLLWLSGPAGTGKTAIMRTVAERSKDRGVHTANFFFSREDPTRNHIQSLVATLLYQIFQFYPDAHAAVAAVVHADTLIFEAGIQEQFDQLMHPLFDILASAEARIVLHIDGLDECDAYARQSQTQLLHALDRLVAAEGSPFLVLISGRPEAHLEMAVTQLSAPVQSIFLDERFTPQKDIRHFVTAEFRKIKSLHPSAHLLANDWPAIPDIEEIVTKSSGQFLYAASVMSFLANSSTLPSLSLQAVQSVSMLARDSAFVHLDAMYINILSMVGDPEAVHDILSSWQFHERHFNYAEKYTTTNIKNFLRHYNPRYTDMFIDSCLSDLAALFRNRDDKFTSYHASLAEFLLEKSRSHRFYIDFDAFCAKAFPIMWRKCVGSLSFAQAHPVGFGLLHYVQTTTPAVTNALLEVQPSDLMHNYTVAWDMTSFVLDISRLYYPKDVKTYKQIVKKWVLWSLRQDRIDIEHFDDFCEPVFDSLFRSSHADVGTEKNSPTIPFGRWYLFQGKIQQRLSSLLEAVHLQS